MTSGKSGTTANNTVPPEPTEEDILFQLDINELATTIQQKLFHHKMPVAFALILCPLDKEEAIHGIANLPKEGLRELLRYYLTVTDTQSPHNERLFDVLRPENPPKKEPT
jgi:hypothetical protein